MIDLNSDSQYSYSFENVTFDTYESIVVSWQDPNDSNSSTNQHTLGAYGGTAMAGFMDAASITVSEADYVRTGLDFTADLNYAVATGQ